MRRASGSVCGRRADPGAAGLLLLATDGDVAGSDPFGLGVILHVDLAAGPLFTLPAQADSAGLAALALPVPASPALADEVLDFQFVFLPSSPAPCAASPLGLTSSRGLRVVVQP